VHIHVIYTVHQAEYGIRFLVAASQEYVNTYSTCRVVTSWPSHDIAMTNIVWCMAYTRGVVGGGGSYIAQ